MHTVKLSVFIACSMGMISMITDIISPDNSMKKQFISLLGLISLLAVLSPWSSDGFTLSLDAGFPEEDMAFSTETEKCGLDHIYLYSAQKQYDEYLSDLLNNNDIRTASVHTYMAADENDEITVTKITVMLYDLSQKDEAYSYIEEMLPETDIEIMAVENERTDQIIYSQPETPAR